MTEEWLSQVENFGQRRERLLDEIEGVLSRFGGDILDNGPTGSMRYLSEHIKDLIVRWADGAIQHEREACAIIADDLLGCGTDQVADAIRARSEAKE